MTTIEGEGVRPRRMRTHGWVKLALKQKYNVMGAVILRDMRTRFFDHGLGFLVVALWPLAHIIILLGIAKGTGRVNPYGDSMYVFLATGLVPTLLFSYISRFMVYSVHMNKPMMGFPIVTLLDILFARAFLEVIGGCITLVAIILLILSVGDNPFPFDLEEAVVCYLATIFVAVGVGLIAGTITIAVPFFSTVYSLMCILFYISSGSGWVTGNLPDVAAIPLSYSPIVQLVEWMRTAYYPTYPDRLVDKMYVLQWGLGSMLVGLALERALRRIYMDN